MLTVIRWGNFGRISIILSNQLSNTNLLVVFLAVIMSASATTNLAIHKLYNGKNEVIEILALLHFRAPPFLLMILVQNFMLIKNHVEIWV